MLRLLGLSFVGSWRPGVKGETVLNQAPEGVRRGGFSRAPIDSRVFPVGNRSQELPRALKLSHILDFRADGTC